MRPRIHTILLAAAAFTLAVSPAFAQQKQQQKLYRWTDKDGVTHYGDQVPPQYASRDREVLNNQGVPIGFQQGALTPAQKAARQQTEQAVEAKQQAKEAVAKHDRMLLQTYLSVADIEALRDRRLNVLDSQMEITQRYLDNLHKQLSQLQDEASKYSAPADGKPAREVPESLAQEISDTHGTISSYETQLQQTSRDKTKLRQSFDSDIARFKELKGG